VLTLKKQQEIERNRLYVRDLAKILYVHIPSRWIVTSLRLLLTTLRRCVTDILHCNSLDGE